MRTFFVCTLVGDAYAHREFESQKEAEDNAREGDWIISAEAGNIVDARFDTPGHAIRAVRRVLKWRGLAEGK